MGNIQTASAAAERAVELNPADDRAWQILGTAAWANGDLATAVSSLDRGFELNPSSAEILMTRAIIAQAHGDAATATWSLEQALAAEPGRPDPYVMLLELLEAQGKDTEHEILRKEFVRKFPHLNPG